LIVKPLYNIFPLILFLFTAVMSKNIGRKESRNMSMETQKELPRDILLRDLGPSIESNVAWFHHMQETQPILYRPEYNLWVVFRYEDVKQVLLDAATFPVDNYQPGTFPGWLRRADPPEHRRLRGLVSKAFTPHRIEELTPRLIQIVDELLESAVTRGKMDVVTEFTYPLLGRVMAEMLGLPPKDHARFQQWSYQLLRHLFGIAHSDTSELTHYFSDLLNERKHAPRDDLMSGLLAAKEDGAHLTHEEIINLCLELMGAGTLTTATLLISALHRLCQHPEMYQDLRDDPSLIPGAIEETLRYDFTMINVWRTAHHDTVFNGHQIKAGQHVVAWVGAANFDETYFPQSSQFDIRRSPNPHLTFSHGIHVCLGAPLGRLEGRIALERIVARFSELRLDPEHPVQFMDQMGGIRLIQSLELLFTPVAPSAS
jgi:cytochrome P450